MSEKKSLAGPVILWLFLLLIGAAIYVHVAGPGSVSIVFPIHR